VLLGSRVSKIENSPTEKNLIFFNGPEINLRSLDLSKKVQFKNIDINSTTVFMLMNFGKVYPKLKISHIIQKRRDS
jgi:hypothetical protein